jgi:NarL family two-component system response regulator YdfI
LIFEAVDDIELVGVAADGAEAVRLTEELQPAVVLMDLRMPGMDGLAALERLRTEQPHIAVVILTTYNEDSLMRRGLRAGACSYLLKDTSGETLLNTIRAAARGDMLLDPDLITGLLTDDAPSAPPTILGLTKREGEVLAAVARGKRSKEIATHLGITERTVKAHLAHIYNKLGVDSRAAAIAVAAQHGLLTGDSEA